MAGINRKCQALWSQEKKFCNTRQIFAAAQQFIKFVIIVFIAMMFAVFLGGNLDFDNYDAILLVLMAAMWLMTMLMAFYLFFQKYKPFHSDHQLIETVHTELLHCNQSLLKQVGYQARSDEWATWISFYPLCK